MLNVQRSSPVYPFQHILSFYVACQKFPHYRSFGEINEKFIHLCSGYSVPPSQINVAASKRESAPESLPEDSTIVSRAFQRREGYQGVVAGQKGWPVRIRRGSIRLLFWRKRGLRRITTPTQSSSPDATGSRHFQLIDFRREASKRKMKGGA